MWTHSHGGGHLQVLTPKVIDRESINQIFDRSLQPLGICVIHSETKVIDHAFGYKKHDRSQVLSRCVLFFLEVVLYFYFILFFDISLIKLYNN
jgi:hypothetical protein